MGPSRAQELSGQKGSERPVRIGARKALSLPRALGARRMPTMAQRRRPEIAGVVERQMDSVLDRPGPRAGRAECSAAPTGTARDDAPSHRAGFGRRKRPTLSGAFNLLKAGALFRAVLGQFSCVQRPCCLSLLISKGSAVSLSHTNRVPTSVNII